jgi:hypothetical protein
MGAAECHEVSRQPIAGDRLARLDRERAALEISELAQGQIGTLNMRKDRPGFGQKGVGLPQ